MATDRNPGCLPVLGVVVLGLILGTTVWSMIDDTPRPVPTFGHLDAFDKCQQAISAVARVPLDDVGYVSPTETADSWTMLWSIADGKLRLRNGFGIPIPAQAFCKVDRGSHAIITLVIDGRVLIGGSG